MHGRAFAGEHKQAAWSHLYGFRGRMDERPDMVRSITDGRYVYVRHFMPHLPEAPQLSYMFKQASTVSWYALHTAGKLNEVQDSIWNLKPTEKLYDLQADPYETKNLASDKEHAGVKAKLSKELESWLIQTRDLGLIPEIERLVQAPTHSPADHFNSSFSPAEALPKVLAATNRDTAPVVELLSAKDTISRYWGCMSLRVHGQVAAQQAAAVAPLLEDSSPAVRIAAADLLARVENADLQAKAWQVLLKSADGDTCSCMESNEALNVMDELGERTKAYAEALHTVNAKNTKDWPKRLQSYPGQVWNEVLTKLGFQPEK
jgi:uncharacterized sulfatase